MKISVFSLPSNDNAKKVVEKIISKNKAFTLTSTKPDVVISVGGDGTFFFTERKYPGVPKILLRKSNICNKCENVSIEAILKHLQQKRYTITTIYKLDANIGKRKINAVNDIIIRNKDLRRALRFTMNIPGKIKNEEIVGDGLVIATPYGSTAYFHAITKTSFKKGIGIAFNNPVMSRNPIITNNKPIKITILREHAIVASDNDPQTFIIKPGDIITIKQSKQKTKIVHI